MDIGARILSDITTFSKYSKYIPELKRRETWEEIISRYEVMQMKKHPSLKKEILKNSKFIIDKKVLPSMRALQFAGPAAEINPARIYNCAYLPIDSLHSFSEGMFLLLGGSGVGYSVQRHHVEFLPDIIKPYKSKKYVVQDSIIGWADAIKVLMKAYFGKGTKPIFDFRDIRPKGAKLITAGGKAPGPEPLRICLNHIEAILTRKNNGEKLTPLECHDIMCHIANSVLSGGIRRAALLVLFSFDDEEMIACKSSMIPSKILKKESITYTDKDGLKTDPHSIMLTVEQDGLVYENCIVRADEKTGKFWDLEQYENDGTLGWWICNEQRGRSNNSVALDRRKISKQDFLQLWKKIESSGCGEPGIYFTNNQDWGTNPCCEIALRPYQFCNLCEVNVSDIKDEQDFLERVRIAAFFGTLQASFTDFHYLRPIWQKTTERDALLGIGMTGIASGEVLKYDLKKAAKVAADENERLAEILRINKATRITCVKPSGTTSCVLGTSSGIHGWHDQYYLRTMRFNKNEDIARHLMINHPELCEDDKLRPHDTVCIRIPIKAPENAILRSESPIDLLERVKLFATDWIKPGHRKGDNTHNVSATISIKPNEWEEVGEWMWVNKEYYNGLSVLNYNGGSYIQAPFESITEKEYIVKLKSLHEIDLTNVIEEDDLVNFGAIAACAGGACEVN
jgi:hypothetical protein